MNTKIALITGASRGLGRALATRLARDGWTLLLTARGPEELSHVAEDLGAGWLAGDVADAAHRAGLVAELERLGGLDLLVNNASSLGATPLPRWADYPLGQLPDLFATNVFAPLALIQDLLPTLRRRGGSVVNISSDAATGGYEGWGGYGATKAALDQASNVLAAEEPDIHVWWVDPGEMRTGMLAEAVGSDADAAPPPEDVATPAIVGLLTDGPASGRYVAAELLAPQGGRA
ncbi:MAG TPA: SDR family oxidoreductase [Stackebrandtia sp.]|uniref:SDR family NAD(P)-dependent oxidoreductase n=1 Tax=Stackebrandtia sp. TaxID=2023065 RepID=UPI002D475E85|nr:SDR family oxidoreductase [Stackebrandtia sp.]HZE39805.1 SDR family oxidoreductase [Stackebrandtia sp.]